MGRITICAVIVACHIIFCVDLSNTPDNFEKELEAVLASVRKSHYLPVSGRK